jgi:hypothetical protein
MILALLLFGMPQSAPVRELLDPQRAVERVSRCGLGRPKLRYDSDLQEDLLMLRGQTRATDGQLACIDKAAEYFLVEMPLALQWRFDAIRRVRLDAQMNALARKWLSTHGLLARVPAYQPGKGDDAAFARSLEQLCGPEASGALKSSGDAYTLDPEWLQQQARDHPDGDAPTCLLNVAFVSGFPLGFFGNEAAP